MVVRNLDERGKRIGQLQRDSNLYIFLALFKRFLRK